MPPPPHPPQAAQQEQQQSSEASQMASHQQGTHPSLHPSQPPPQPPPPLPAPSAPPASLPSQPGPTGMLPPVMPMSMSMPMPMPPPLPHGMPPHPMPGAQLPIRSGPPPPGHAPLGPRGQQQHQQPPLESDDDGGLPQLPPQMFTTAAQLLDMTDKKLVLVLRDGRKLVGILRSWDQFANLVLQDTVEKIYAGNLFAEQKRGIYIVRGENVLLLGEIDLDKEDDLPPNFQQGEWKRVLALKEKEDSDRKKLNNNRGRQLHDLGFEAEHSGEVLF